MLSITAMIVSYLVGSINFSLLIGKWLCGIDIRQYGSGNAGATNTLRILGKGPAMVVLLLDAAKGMAAVLFGYLLTNYTWVTVLCGAAAIVGHNWPIYFHFRGGKGVATTIGVLAVLAFWAAFCAGIIAVVLIIWKRYVSLGSLLFAGLTPIFIFLFRYDWSIFWGSLLLCFFAFYQHRSNMVKIIRGTENQLSSKKGGMPRV